MAEQSFIKDCQRFIAAVVVFGAWRFLFDLASKGGNS
jgi:hypothetical protein